VYYFDNVFAAAGSARASVAVTPPAKLARERSRFTAVSDTTTHPGDVAP
jgi:hypothetical protein